MGEITSQVSSQDLRFPTLFWRYVPIWEVPTFFIVLVRSSISSCSKWPASSFDTEPNVLTTTGTTFLLDFQILLICLASSWYFSYFSVSFCSTYLREQLCPQWLFPLPSFSEWQCLASCGGFHGLFGWKSPTTVLLPHSLLHFWGNAHTIILSLHSNPYSLHASQWMNRPTNSFYILSA